MVLLDRTDPLLKAETRAAIKNGGNVRITNLDVWRVGLAAHAAIIGVTGAADKAIQPRLTPVHELARVAVEVWQLRSFPFKLVKGHILSYWLMKFTMHRKMQAGPPLNCERQHALFDHGRSRR